MRPSAAILEPAIAARVPGLSQPTRDLQNLIKATQIAEANQRTIHASYTKGTLPSPQVSAAPYDPDVPR